MSQLQALGTQAQQVTKADDIAPLMTQLKKCLLKEGLLAMTSTQTNPSNPNYNSTISKLKDALNTFHSLAVVSIKYGKFDIFNQLFTQLSPFYVDFLPLFGDVDQSVTQTRLTVVAVKLLLLLTDNTEKAHVSLQEFHCQLEYLTAAERSNPQISAVLSLEQSLMQGAYSTLIKSKQVQELKQAIPGVETVLDNLKFLVYIKVAYALSQSSTSYPISQLQSTYKLSNEDLQEFIKVNNLNIVDQDIIFDKKKTIGGGETMGDDESNQKPQLNEKQLQLQEDKAKANKFVAELIKIAQQSEKIV